MEQMYLIEIFIDKVTVYTSPEDENSGANKKLIIKVNFGPKTQFIIKEGQLAANEDATDDVVDCDENGKRKWSRTIRVGKSYLFPSYPDTVLMTLSKFPLELEVWNDDETEEQIYVGIGTMHWDTAFFHMLKDTAEACKLHEPLSIKQTTVLFAECCCKQCGEVSFILRLSALGDGIITEFQQLMKDPETFVFRTNKAPSMFSCKRIEGDDPNFCMIGSLYETTTLEDPTLAEAGKQKIEVCTELQSCGVAAIDANITCAKDDNSKKQKYPIEKIRMGDITGPCGNTNCPLAHKVKMYIRNLEAYKKAADGNVSGTKSKETQKICGTCGCKDDRYHRDSCPAKIMAGEAKEKAMCSGCGGIVKAGETCEDKKGKQYGTGTTPKPSKTHVAYVFSVTQVPDFKESVRGKKFLTDSLGESYNRPPERQSIAIGTANTTVSSGCGCHKVIQAYQTTTRVTGTSTDRGLDNNSLRRSMGMGISNQVYQLDVKSSRRKSLVYNCTDIVEDKDCKCEPPKPTPPCKTFDCDCIMETVNVAARKTHRPYCPAYKHKTTCPVTMMNEEEDKKEDDEDETEPLPYGLPPIKLGPCPVMGRPCTVPDGFARMYRNAVIPTQPPSYSDAGKVCCSKEYERIKKAIKEYMTYEKDHDFRCINKFNVDTERRCCDKEQVLMALKGKGCCGAHKLAIQEQYKEERK